MCMALWGVVALGLTLATIAALDGLLPAFAAVAVGVFVFTGIFVVPAVLAVVEAWGKRGGRR